VWNPYLAALASEFTAQCVSGHSNQTWRNVRYGELSGVPFDANSMSTYVGENLAGSTGSSVTASGWIDEKNAWNCTGNTCPTGQQCGHYTQVVWQDTTSVGCGIATCPDANQVLWQRLSCNYNMAGNWVGNNPFDDIATCSKIVTSKRFIEGSQEFVVEFDRQINNPQDNVIIVAIIGITLVIAIKLGWNRR